MRWRLGWLRSHVHIFACPSVNDQPIRRYSPQIAAAALQRAAKLQIQTNEQAEGRATDNGTADAGFARCELIEAAAEAGIDERFVSVALAEVDGTRLPEGVDTEPAQERAMTRWLGTSQRQVRISRLIEGTPTGVWSAIGTVFEADSCGLTLRRLTDGHPTTGGVAEFDMTPLNTMVANRGGAYTLLCYRMQQLGVRTLRVQLHDRGDHTEVTIDGDLRPGAALNLRWGRRFGGLTGLLGAGSGIAIAASAGILVGAAAGALGLATGAMGILGLWRGSYRHNLRKLEGELGSLLGGVDGYLRRQTAYRLTPVETPDAGLAVARPS